MKSARTYLLLFSLSYSLCLVSANQSLLPVGSVVDKIIDKMNLYQDTIGGYKANLYIKGCLDIKKSNLLLNYYPMMMRPQKGVSEYIIESYSKLHYASPNVFDNKIIASSGTTGGAKNVNNTVMTLLNSNIYSGLQHNKNLVSPFAPKAKQYYKYEIDSVLQEEGYFIYRLSFTPIYNNYNLIEGSVSISSPEWKIDEIRYKKRSDNSDYIIHIQLDKSDDQLEALLPKRVDIKTKLYFVGNLIEGNFNVHFDYTSVEALAKKKREKKKYDLTPSFTLQNDSSIYAHLSSNEFEKFRLSPLTEMEKKLYIQSEKPAQDSIKSTKTSFADHPFWRNMNDLLFESHTINSPQMGEVQFSPLLYPSLLEYAWKTGFSYQQRIRYNRYFENNAALRISPQFGYNLSYNEFYFKLPLRWEYLPLKNAFLHAELGNGNYIYPSDIAYKLGLNRDSIDFDRVNIDYYRDFYAKLDHNIELFNGFNVNAGLVVHKRSAVKKRKKEPILEEDKITDSYMSFAPRISLSWTPGLYYYKTTNRKINLYSHFPTLSLDYERSFDRVFDSSIRYEKIEVDLQHRLSIGPLESMFYRLGVGVFTEQKDRFFIDFRYFSKNNLPTSWNDQMGGVFQLLDRWWYNSSRRYIRGNLTYEVPFFLTPYLRSWTKSVINERFYFGMLVMPGLNPYAEFGYGIGTKYFDIGVFLNNINGEFRDLGAKFTFHFN